MKPLNKPELVLHQQSEIASIRWCYAGLLLSMLLVLALYRETVASLIAIWTSSATFAHGMLIPPVSIWLIWRQRSRWQALPCTPLPALLPVILAAGLIWLCAAFASAPVLRQFALIGMLVTIAILWQGWPRARIQAFPLIFFFFAVPFGEFLTPSLVEVTTRFTVMALDLTGIPVLRENNMLSLPSGDWSVQEACSGLRYLIATLAVASLYAYLGLQSRMRRSCFMLVALLLPILANGLRAVAIILLGHYTDMRWATGVDHLLYGWLFFALLLLLLFGIGARWRQLAPPTSYKAQHPAPAGIRARAALCNLVLLATSVTIWPAMAYWLPQNDNRDLHRLSWRPPAAPPTWQVMQPQAHVVGSLPAVSTRVAAKYTRDGHSIQLELLAVSSSDAVEAPPAIDVAMGDHWQLLQTTARSLQFKNASLQLQEMLEQNGRQSQYVLQWYRMHGKNYAALWQLRLQQLLNRLRGQSALAFRIRLCSGKNGANTTSASAMYDFLGALYLPLLRELDHAAQ